MVAMALTTTNTEVMRPNSVSLSSHSSSRTGSTPRATDTSIWSTRLTRAMTISGVNGKRRPDAAGTPVPLMVSSTRSTLAPLLGATLLAANMQEAHTGSLRIERVLKLGHDDRRARHTAHHLGGRPRGRAARPVDQPPPGPVCGRRAPGGAGPGEVRLLRRRVQLREGRAGRRVVRLVALRRPRLPVPQAVRRRRLRRAGRHPHDLRRHPARLLDPVRAPGRHDGQPRRGVDLLPQHPPPLLRADVLRTGGEA